jgi:broad specificity phosphatase PhoE
VLLVRHAPSVWNLEGRWQGQADPPLAPAGAVQAEAAAREVGVFELVIASNLERARHTASILAPDTPIETEPLLREFDVGQWSGRTRAEIQRYWPEELARFDVGNLDTPPGGEHMAAFDERVRAGSERVAARALAMGARRTLVVGHGGVIRALGRLQGRPDRHVGHLCGYEAEVKGGTVAFLQPIDLLTGSRPPSPVGDVTSL